MGNICAVLRSLSDDIGASVRARETRPSSLRMEPSRQLSCAIMSPRRAVHSETYQQILPMLRDWADIAQSASVILASLFAIYGIDAWRREFIGKRRMELAEEVLALFYQARDVIRAIRSPFGYVGEGGTRKTASDERPEDKEALDQAFVLVERYNRNIEPFSRIHALRYRFMVQLGVDAAGGSEDDERHHRQSRHVVFSVQ